MQTMLSASQKEGVFFGPLSVVKLQLLHKIGYKCDWDLATFQTFISYLKSCVCLIGSWDSVTVGALLESGLREKVLQGMRHQSCLIFWLFPSHPHVSLSILLLTYPLLPASPATRALRHSRYMIQELWHQRRKRMSKSLLFSSSARHVANTMKGSFLFAPWEVRLWLSFLYP